MMERNLVKLSKRNLVIEFIIINSLTIFASFILYLTPKSHPYYYIISIAINMSCFILGFRMGWIILRLYEIIRRKNNNT